MVSKVIKTLFLVCSVFIFQFDSKAQIAGSEETPDGNHCKLCLEQVPYECSTSNCGVTTVNRQKVSEYIDPKPPYPNAKNLVCIPCDCGNRVTENQEECDDGNHVGFDGCTADCRREICGDGVKQPYSRNGITEQCDAGKNNRNEPDQCRENCLNPRCGDGIKDSNEECDLGAKNADGFTGCDLKCQTITCGDHEKNGGEECDDGNLTNGDGCDNSCHEEIEPCSAEDLNRPLPASGDLNGIGHVATNICLRGRFVLGGVRATWGGVNIYDLIYERNNSLDVGRVDGQSYVDHAVNVAGVALNQTERDGTGIWNGEYSYIYSKSKGIICYTCATVRVAGCFAPETEIKLESGADVQIQDLKAGDLVLNPITGDSAKVKSVLESFEEKPLVQIKISNGKLLKVTDGHPIFTPNGVKKAKDLKVTDKVLSEEGEELEITGITLSEPNSKQRVLNITLDVEGHDEQEFAVSASGITAGDLTLQKKLAK